MHDNQTEEHLLTIIGLLSSIFSKETEVYSSSINQIRMLITDAVEKINIHFLAKLEEEEELAFEKSNAQNLLFLLHKALDISKLINKKMDGIMRAVQIDDIAGQIVDELLSRMTTSELFLRELQMLFKDYKEKPPSKREELLLSAQSKIQKMLDTKAKNHVQQKDLDEGSMELF